MSESIEQVIDTNPESIPESIPEQTSEDKFFGVTNEINTASSKDIEVEVIDERPEEDRRPPKVETKEEPVDDEALDKEIADYSKKAGERINKIKYEFHEERRAKEQALRESQEATRALKTLMKENQKLQSVVSQGGDVLNQQALNNAQWAKYNAQEKFKKAYEEGNAEEMALAQTELAQATLAEQQAGNYAEQLQTDVASKYVEQEQQIEKPSDPDMDAWSKKNPWFMGTDPIHKEMTSYAMYLDQSLQVNGIDPAKDSQKYYSEIDAKMKEQFPNFFGVTQQQPVETEEVEITPKRQVTNPVAPATRNSGKSPRKIHLTQSQVALAKRLNITPEQYANQLLKET
jgi:hypothetical protein|tara:strand:- start:848 stop:1882 length:1035 start_codon:yes stop_codon:yes gene_type:complete